MVRLTRGWFVCAVFAWSVLAPLSGVMAQTRGQSAVPTPQQLNPSATRAAPAAHTNDIFIAPEPGPCPLRDSKLSFVLKGVEFTGAAGVKNARLLPSYDGLIGQRVPVWTVCDIRDRATAVLFRAGILARVEIPDQRITDGKLRLEVIEARIASVRFHGDAGPAESKVEDYLEHLRGLIPFDLNIAQRYLLLASEVPGVQISAAIRPSAQGRGAVDLDVTATRKIVDAAANIQNFGSKNLGPWAGLARVDLNGLTPYGDKTSAVLYTTADGREQRVAQLLEELRPGDSGLVVRASGSYSETRPEGNLSSVNITGDAVDAQFSVSYPIIRKQRVNLSVTGGLEYVDERSDIAGAPLINDRIRVLFARAQTDGRGYVLGLPWQAGAGLELRKGLDLFDSSQSGENDLSELRANPDAFVQRLDAHFSLHATPLVELYLAGAAQDADTPLVTFEQLAVGNLTYGRGYDPSSIAGDRGGAGTVELRLGPIKPVRTVTLAGYGFFDVAYVNDIDPQENQETVHTVRSAGGGIRFNFNSRFDLDLGYAQPLDKATITANKPPAGRVLVTVSAQY